MQNIIFPFRPAVTHGILSAYFLLMWVAPSQYGFSPERIFQSAPNRILIAHSWWLSAVLLRYSVWLVQCMWRIVHEDWWLSSYYSSVVDHWQLKCDCWLLFLPHIIICCISGPYPDNDVCFCCCALTQCWTCDGLQLWQKLKIENVWRVMTFTP